MADSKTAGRFWSKVIKGDTGCWYWTAAKVTRGYGYFYIGGNSHVLAHRWAYQERFGPIPEGLQLDHLCRNRACVNPEHLEPVTASENISRGLNGYAIRTTCRNQHDITDALNIYTYMNRGRVKRTCRSCLREWKQRQREQSHVR